MKILTNLKQLSNIDKYNKNSSYIDANVFTLCQYNPTIIISADKDEVDEAFYDYPNIKFIGPGLNFPNRNLNVPAALLDERLLTSNITLERKSFEIGYICKRKSCPYINKLSRLGNLKIMGPVININTIYENINDSIIAPFYKLAKICFVTDLESALLVLNMSGKCLGTPEVVAQCQYVDSIDSISCRDDLLNLIESYANPSSIARRLDAMEYSRGLSYKAFFENLSKGISNET